MVVTDAQTIARVTGGEVVAGDGRAMAGTVTIDSREVTAGSAFVALPGESGRRARLRGGGAATPGHGVVVVTRDDAEVRAAFDARGQAATPRSSRWATAAAALAALARYNRSRLICPVVAVTGSTGKTTTKDFIFSALSTGREVVATEGNRNNELGVPLTLLRADLTTGAVVVEMGMRGSGQIGDLCALARPTIGLDHQHRHDPHGASRQPGADRARQGRAPRVPAGRTVARSSTPTTSGRPGWPALTKAAVTTYGTGEAADVRAIDIDDRRRADASPSRW